MKIQQHRNLTIPSKARRVIRKIKAIVSDFSRTLLVPKDPSYTGMLNPLFEQVSTEPNFDFWAYFQLHQKLLAYYRSLKDKYRLAVLTSGYLQAYPAVAQVLDTIFERVVTTKELGLRKNDPQVYALMARMLELDPGEILYIDDSLENCAVAQAAGMQTVRFESEEQAIDQITKSLVESN